MASHRIPIKVRGTRQSDHPGEHVVASVQEAAPPVVDTARWPEPSSHPKERRVPEEQETATSAELEQWRDRALRLEAEMDNFRKRQRKLADERVAADRERLLRSFLAVADDLDRALSVDGTDAARVAEGVSLTRQKLLHMLEQEGVRPLQAQGCVFDPNLHEAISTLPCQEQGTDPDRVVEVVSCGYMLDDRLLRPARVVVAT